MKIKLTKTLRTEQRTLHILLATSIAAFLLSMFLELAVSPFICVSLYENLHLNYLINIMLGISCSAIISFIGLIFPYLHRKNGQIENILFELREIYYKYLLIHQSISDIRPTDDYSFEKFLCSDVDDLTEKIYSVRTNYENSSFTSGDIDEINKVLLKEIQINLSVIKKFCSFFFIQENIIKQHNVDENENPQILKDVATKRAQKDCYKFLLEKIESLFPLADLQRVYKNVWSFSDLNNYTVNEFKQIIRKVDENDNLKLEFALGLEIQSQIFEIRNKYYTAYTNDCEIIKERLYNIIEQSKKNNTDKMEGNNSYIDEIYNAMRNDDLHKAKEMLDEIENKIKNEE